MMDDDKTEPIYLNVPLLVGVIFGVLLYVGAYIGGTIWWAVNNV